MTKLILSTSNLINGGPSISRRPIFEKSNTEFTNSLRANFQSAKDEQNFEDSQDSGKELSNGVKHSIARWVQRDGEVIYIPALDKDASGLAEERSQYDITVKLFFLPTTNPSKRCSHTEEAIDLVLQELQTPSIDLLIISYPGVTFDADDDEYEGSEASQVEKKEMEDMIQTWRTLEGLQRKGVVHQIGLSEFGSERLKKFLPLTKVRPSVDQINVRDCCVVPKSLILYAKQEEIELLTHNDCTNILPKGTIRELLGAGKDGAGILSDGSSDGLTGDIEPQWVVKYTAVVKDRGVIENKGYFAMAEMYECDVRDDHDSIRA